MKKIIAFCLGLIIPSTFAAQISSSDVIEMHRYFDQNYNLLIENLREGRDVNRQDVIGALSGDPFLQRVKTRNGHEKFSHKFLPLTISVIAHDNLDIESDKELRSFHRFLQVYVDTIRLFAQEQGDIHRASREYSTLSKEEWTRKYLKNVEAAAKAINNASSNEWTCFISTIEESFDRTLAQGNKKRQ